MPLESLASGEKQSRPELVLVQNSGHVDDDTNFCVGCIPQDGWTRESLHDRDEDAGDLMRSELNELVESMTSLNALAGEK